MSQNVSKLIDFKSKSAKSKLIFYRNFLARKSKFWPKVRRAIWLNSGLVCWHYGPISQNSFRQFSSNSLFFECGGPRPKTLTFGFRRNRDSINFALKPTVELSLLSLLSLRGTFKATVGNRVAESPESDSSKFWFWLFFIQRSKPRTNKNTKKISGSLSGAGVVNPIRSVGRIWKKNWAKLKTSENHWIPPQKFLLGPRVGHLWSGGWKSNFLSKKIIKLRKKCSTIFWRREKSLCCDHFADKH